jgi:hypothetical protein
VPTVVAVVLGFLLLVVLVAPAGYGLPAPAVALSFLVLGVPGAIGIWLLYRRMTARGDVPPIGEGNTARERRARGEDTEDVVEPSSSQNVEFVGTGRSADDEPSAPERTHG